MRKPRSTDYLIGSPQYIVDHALWKKRKGKNPSLPFLSYKNPLKALKRAFEYVPPKTRADYLKDTPLNMYVCSDCGASDVKLWRESDVPHPILFCSKCTAKKENVDISKMNIYGIMKDVNGHTSDWIGNYLPAIPTETETSESDIFFWLGHSIPKAAAVWWWTLPLFPKVRRRVTCMVSELFE